MRGQNKQLVRNTIEAAIVPSIIGYQNVKLTPRSELLEINAKFCPLTPVRVGVRKRQSLSVLESHFVVANRLKMDGFDMRILPDLRDEVPNERSVLCHKRRSFRSVAPSGQRIRERQYKNKHRQLMKNGVTDALIEV
jgi:hypothetical protein